MRLPHCGQKLARPRTDAPQLKHRRAISGSDIKPKDKGGTMKDEVKASFLQFIFHRSAFIVT
jgi:hypothetical protein